MIIELMSSHDHLGLVCSPQQGPSCKPLPNRIKTREDCCKHIAAIRCVNPASKQNAGNDEQISVRDSPQLAKSSHFGGGGAWLYSGHIGILASVLSLSLQTKHGCLGSQALPLLAGDGDGNWDREMRRC